MNNEEKILALLEKMDTRIGKIEDNITSIKARIDYDVDVRLKALAEGQDAIEQRLDTLEGTVSDVKDLAESTKDMVDVVKAVVTRHSASIAELKTAQ